MMSSNDAILGVATLAPVYSCISHALLGFISTNGCGGLRQVSRGESSALLHCICSASIWLCTLFFGMAEAPNAMKTGMPTALVLNEHVLRPFPTG